MRRERSLQNIIIIVLAIAILAMSVGFAAYEQKLNINGTATFNKASWDVHFDTASFSEEASTIKATSKTVGTNTISYAVTLAKPGDTYTFTVNAKNYGTIDAKLVGITLGGLTEEQKKFITYSVNYAGTDYEYPGTSTGLNVSLPAGESSTAAVTITVNYVYPEAAEELPSEDTTVNLTATFDYQSVQ